MKVVSKWIYCLFLLFFTFYHNLFAMRLENSDFYEKLPDELLEHIFVMMVKNEPIKNSSDLAELVRKICCLRQINKKFKIFLTDDKILKILFEAGVDLQRHFDGSYDVVGNTPLFYAKNYAVTKFLLHAGVDSRKHNFFECVPHVVHPVDKSFVDTLLLMAIDNGDEDGIRSLLEAGVHPDYKICNKPILYFAVENGYKKIVELLLEFGASSGVVFEGKTILQVAQEKGYDAIKEVVLKFTTRSVPKATTRRFQVRISSFGN